MKKIYLLITVCVIACSALLTAAFALSGSIIEINGKTVYGIGEDCDFIICLNVLIDDTTAEELCTYRPGRILFTDSCFKDTEMRTNVEHTIKNINEKIKCRVV